jgi:hypothetical protein
LIVNIVFAKMLVSKKSIHSGIVRTLDINISKEDYEKFLKGAPFEEVAKNLSKEEREFLMTGMTLKEAKQFDKGI